MPGSQRVCFISRIVSIGACKHAPPTAGAFGPCREQRPPAECDAIARTHGASRELEHAASTTATAVSTLTISTGTAIGAISRLMRWCLLRAVRPQLFVIAFCRRSRSRDGPLGRDVRPTRSPRGISRGRRAPTSLSTSRLSARYAATARIRRRRGHAGARRGCDRDTARDVRRHRGLSFVRTFRAARSRRCVRRSLAGAARAHDGRHRQRRRGDVHRGIDDRRRRARSFRRRAMAHLGRRTRDDDCTDSLEDRFTFDLSLDGATDDGGSGMLTLLVFQSKGAERHRFAAPGLTQRFPDQGWRVRVQRRSMSAAGNVCFAALARDSSGRVSNSADREVCTVHRQAAVLLRMLLSACGERARTARDRVSPLHRRRAPSPTPETAPCLTSSRRSPLSWLWRRSARLARLPRALLQDANRARLAFRKHRSSVPAIAACSATRDFPTMANGRAVTWAAPRCAPAVTRPPGFLSTCPTARGSAGNAARPVGASRARARLRGLGARLSRRCRTWLAMPLRHQRRGDAESANAMRPLTSSVTRASPRAPCLDGLRCIAGRCTPEPPSPSCILDSDCQEGALPPRLAAGADPHEVEALALHDESGLPEQRRTRSRARAVFEVSRRSRAGRI